MTAAGGTVRARREKTVKREKRLSTSRPSPRAAFWLSLAFPGLGLFYSGAPLRAMVVAALAFLGFFGAIDSFNFMDRQPEYAWYGTVAVVLFVAAWWGGAWHARTVAARFKAWPALYQRELWQALKPARAEIGMVIVFAALLALYAQYPKQPGWLPDVPRYWFLYEAFGALYLVVATQSRIVVFFSITLAVTLGLILFTRIPPDAVVLAYVLALPSCWQSLHSEQARRIHGYRFASALMSALLALFAYGIVLWVAEAATGLRQYQLRLASDDNVATAAFGIIYYALRAGSETLIQVFANPART
jgi:TM2 domain-containing membrane protein YozV